MTRKQMKMLNLRMNQIMKVMNEISSINTYDILYIHLAAVQWRGDMSWEDYVKFIIIQMMLLVFRDSKKLFHFDRNEGKYDISNYKIRKWQQNKNRTIYKGHYRDVFKGTRLWLPALMISDLQIWWIWSNFPSITNDIYTCFNYNRRSFKIISDAFSER